jgi:hypothetical protein
MTMSYMPGSHLTQPPGDDPAEALGGLALGKELRCVAKVPHRFERSLRGVEGSSPSPGFRQHPFRVL